jgi:hypothetical protein
MAARSDRYRRLAIQAKQQRARASDPEVKQGFADIADHWAGLAEQSDWLDTRLASSFAQQQQIAVPSSDQQPTLQQQQEQSPKPENELGGCLDRITD